MRTAASPSPDGGGTDDLGFIDDAVPGGGDDAPPEPELDEDGNPIEPEPELDEDGNPIEPEPEPDDRRQQPQRQQTRRGREHRLQEQLAETRRRYDDLAREVAEIRRQPPQPQVSPADLARQEQEKWARRAEMSPVELVQDVQREVEARVGQAFQQQQLQTQDLIDRQQYDALSTNSRAHASYRDRVEDLVQRERARGVMVGREQAFAWLWYQDQKKRLSNGAPQQRASAARRVANQQTRPGGARGDVGRGNGRAAQGSAADDDRLVDEYFRNGGRL